MVDDGVDGTVFFEIRNQNHFYSKIVVCDPNNESGAGLIVLEYIYISSKLFILQCLIHVYGQFVRSVDPMIWSHACWMCHGLRDLGTRPQVLPGTMPHLVW